MSHTLPALRFLFINGRNACGKDTQAKLLIKGDSRAVRISPGEILREASDPMSPYHQYFKDHLHLLDEGGLVPGDLLTRKLRTMIEDHIQHGIRTFVFTGYPREEDSLDAMDQYLLSLKDRGYRVTQKMALINVDEKDSIERYTDRVNAALARGDAVREDDNDLDKLMKRMSVFETVTVPMMNKLRARGRLIDVNGKRSIRETQDELRGLLRWQLHRTEEGASAFSVDAGRRR